jgi:NTE family protein
MKIKNLVIGGGGVKSFSYIGILQKLYNEKKLKNVNNLLGVSGGSIILYLYSIGYTPDELEKLAINLDLKALFGNPSINNIFLHKSLSSTDFLYIFLQKLTFFKLKVSNLTMNEHFIKTNLILNIGCSCINTDKFVIFNFKTNPSSDIFKIILASCSIPGIFPPQKIGKYLYCDGGIFNNYPIDYFKKNINNTLGIIIFDKSTTIKNSNIILYMSSIILSMIRKKILININLYKNNTIVIALPKYTNLVDFNLTSLKIKEFIDYGKKNEYINFPSLLFNK